MAPPASLALGAAIVATGAVVDSLHTLLESGVLSEESADYVRRAAVAVIGARVDLRAARGDE